MLVRTRSLRRAVAVIATVALSAVALSAVGAVGCGDDGDDVGATSTPTAATATAPAAGAADLGPVKQFLLDHTERLTAATAELKDVGARYGALAERYGFDHAAMLEGDREAVAALIAEGKAAWKRANPAYEEAEGVVAGVPVLSRYDVIIDAGAAGPGEDAVPFDLTLSDDRVLQSPGNFFFLTETSLWGTNPDFAADGVTPDLDADGRVEFGESVPDARFLVAATEQFDVQARALARDGAAWQPTESDAFTALVVMTPTMSEYFGAWKNSRAVAGDAATEQAFVGSSRLVDIVDILEGLQVIYEGVRPRVAEADPQRAAQTGASLQALTAFVADVRDREAAGTTFTPEQADTLGSEAQGRAEQIAGQLAQTAEALDIPVEAG